MQRLNLTQSTDLTKAKSLFIKIVWTCIIFCVPKWFTSVQWSQSLNKVREHRLHIKSSVCVSWFACFPLADCGNRLKAFSSRDVRFFRNSSLRVHQLLCDTIPLIMRGKRRNRCRTDSVWRTEFCGEAKKVFNSVILWQYRLRIESQILQNYLYCVYR